MSYGTKSLNTAGNVPGHTGTGGRNVPAIRMLRVAVSVFRSAGTPIIRLLAALRAALAVYRTTYNVTIAWNTGNAPG